MQNKGAIRLFAIVFAIVSLYQLSFTFFASKVESNADEYANRQEIQEKAEELADGDAVLQRFYLDSLAQTNRKYFLDSMSNEVVYNIGIRKYTYQECKERELNLGLDLKGGMNVTLEVSVVDVIKSMAADKVTEDPDSDFNQAIEMAKEKQKDSQEDFVTLFYESLQEINPDARLAPMFTTIDLRDRINPNSTDEEVLKVISNETESAIDRSFEILRTRIDRFGVAQPNIQKLQSAGRILVELPGVKDPERVRSLLQGTAHLQFFETYEFSEIYDVFTKANERVSKIVRGEKLDESIDSSKVDSAAKQDVLMDGEEKPVASDEEDDDEGAEDLLDEFGEGADQEDQSSDSSDLDDLVQQDDEDTAQAQEPKNQALFNVLMPAFGQDDQGRPYPMKGPVVGYAEVKDTAKVNRYLNMPQVKSLFPRDLKLAWSVKPMEEQENVYMLVALKTERGGKAPLSGDKVVNAKQDVRENGEVEVTMMMDSEGARIWKRLTGANKGRSIAIVLDEYVYSFPTVQGEIPNGRSSISGNFTTEEAQDLANILKAGKLPAPAKIVEEAVVGPSLGEEAVNAGLISFIIAFVVVLIYMISYYSKAGLVADLALLTNVFFIFGVLASLQAVLTLPGIAGIVLTLGMAVDANVIIYERIKEEVRAGKGKKLAIADGYKNAYSAIIDGNVTTLITGVVLVIFGSGPVKGFATTLIIGILTSLFTAIFLSRLVFSWMANKNIEATFANKLTMNTLANVKFDFISKRKIMYTVSIIVILIGVISLSFKGLNYGVDFSGGRTYVVRFDKDINTVKLSESLSQTFVDDEGNTYPPEVKTFGPSNQVKVTTEFLIEDDKEETDSIVATRLYEGSREFYDNEIDLEEFISSTDDDVIGIMSSQKVGPTIADDIKRNAVLAIAIALVLMFTYIAIRFRKWQYGLGGLSALFHDSLIVVSLYSIFHGILPFAMEVDQSFIAAILTIIGYSINDSVVIFDRIREHKKLYPKRSRKDNINSALNSTLARTFNTSGTTFLVLLIIFLLGGEVIRGFAFALMIGVLVGTYSSLFNASPIAYDLLMADDKKKQQKVEKAANQKKKKKK
ncbi:MAG: protein translocase subunit SecDF [Bacteroidota bacterium]